jgi:hypothetical protein
MADPGDNHQPTHSRKKQQLHPLDVWNDKAIATTEEDVLELCDEFLKDIAHVGHCLNIRGRRKMGCNCVSVFRHREQEESEDDALSNADSVISRQIVSRYLVYFNGLKKDAQQRTVMD